MAETVLVMQPLFDRLLTAGRELVDALRKKGFPLTAAFWMLDPYEMDWKLFVAADGVRSQGPAQILWQGVAQRSTAARGVLALRDPSRRLNQRQIDPVCGQDDVLQELHWASDCISQVFFSAPEPLRLHDLNASPTS